MYAYSVNFEFFTGSHYGLVIAVDLIGTVLKGLLLVTESWDARYLTNKELVYDHLTCNKNKLLE